MTSQDNARDIRELKRQVQALSSRNAKLAELLQTSRDKLSSLYAEIDMLAEPASTYGIYLAGSNRGREAEVFTSGRQMRLSTLR